MEKAPIHYQSERLEHKPPKKYFNRLSMLFKSPPSILLLGKIRKIKVLLGAHEKMIKEDCVYCHTWFWMGDNNSTNFLVTIQHWKWTHSKFLTFQSVCECVRSLDRKVLFWCCSSVHRPCWQPYLWVQSLLMVSCQVRRFDIQTYTNKTNKRCIIHREII